MMIMVRRLRIKKDAPAVGIKIDRYLVVRETMQEAALVDVLELDHDITITTTTGGGNNVLVKGKGNEDDNGQKVDSSTDSTHTLGDLISLKLAHIATSEARAHESRTQRADHGVA